MGDDGGYTLKSRPPNRWLYPYERERDPALRFSPPALRRLHHMRPDEYEDEVAWPAVVAGQRRLRDFLAQLRERYAA